MQHIYCTESLSFWLHSTSRHLFCLGNFKNFVMVMFRLLHLHTIMSRPFRFLVTVDYAASKVMFQCPIPVPSLVLHSEFPWYVGWPVWSSPWQTQLRILCSLQLKHTLYFITGQMAIVIAITRAISSTACDWVLYHMLCVTPTTSAVCYGWLMLGNLIYWTFCHVTFTGVVHVSDTVCM